jgi:hypothetical protein
MSTVKRLPTKLNSRKGQSLVEFAVVSLVLYMLLAAILTFGHMLYVAQGLQSAADLAAREISRTPFEAIHPTAVPQRSLTFEDVTTTATGFTANDKFRKTIFDEAFLVIDLDQFYAKFPGPNPNIYEHLVPTLPILNQQLVPLMIVDRPSFEEPPIIIGGPVSAQRRLLRYPGAILSRSSKIVPPSGVANTLEGPYENPTTYKPWFDVNLKIEIPLVVSTANGITTIRLIDILEEIKSPNAASPFSIDSEQRGLVSLRINYPFQSAAMSSFRHDPSDPEYPFEPTVGRPEIANNVINPGGDLNGNTLVPLPLASPNANGRFIYSGTHGGTAGLGAQGAFGTIVRPYRRIMSAQAIYRREIFE